MFKDFKNLTAKRKALTLNKMFLPILLGGTAGYLYYHYIGCVSGHCPITGNPYISTGYGAALGTLFVNWKSNKTK
jgi:phage shock protein E